MNKIYSIIRAIIVVVIAIAITVPATLYVGLSLPPVQREISDVARHELSRLLDADVSIGSLTITPFNRVMLRDVAVAIDDGRDTVMKVDRLGSGINLYELAVNHRVTVNYVEIIGLDLKLRRDSAGAPLNIQPVIDRLAGDKDKQEETAFDMAVNTVVLRNSSITYDVDDMPLPANGRFSPHHIALYDLSADLQLPGLGASANRAIVKRFMVTERSGLSITDLSGRFLLSPDLLAWRGVTLEMPHSRVRLLDSRIDNPDHKPVAELITTSAIKAGIADGSHIAAADVAPLLPATLDLGDTDLGITATLSGTVARDSRLQLRLTDGRDLSLTLSAQGYRLTDTLERRLSDIRLTASLPLARMSHMLNMKPKPAAMLATAGHADVTLRGSLSTTRANLAGTVATDAGTISVDSRLSALDTRRPAYTVNLGADDIALGRLLANRKLGLADATVKANGHLNGTLKNITSTLPTGNIEVNIGRLDFNGHPWGDIRATAATTAKGSYRVNVTSDDPAARFTADAWGDMQRGEKNLKLNAVASSIDLAEVTGNAKFEGQMLRFSCGASLSGSQPDDISGDARLYEIVLKQPGSADPVKLDGVNVTTALNADGTRHIGLESDIVSASADGYIYFSTIARHIKETALLSLPALLPPGTAAQGPDNDFTYKITVHDTEPWANRLHFPVSNLGHSLIYGSMSSARGDLDINIDAPYLRQGNKLIEKTSLRATVNGADGLSELFFTTKIPTKEGLMKLNLDADAINDSLSTDITWHIERAARYDGHVSADARFAPLTGGTAAHITVNPGTLTFNDSTWTLNRATVDVYPGMVDVHGINAHRAGQFVKIDGRASHLPDDEISIDLLGINLDYIFESLGIDKVMLGGDATGRFFASNLYSQEPRLLTEGLNVKQISYNKVVLGDAIVKSRWDKDNRAITLDAVIDQPNGLKTLIDGAIYPLNDSLDITFDAHDVDIAFMHPYMSAFASEVSGRASGVARLWGNFKYIDMEGDIAGKDLKLKLTFTNTTYTTTDTISLRLGEITIDDMLLSDDYGNTARLSGKVWHKFFKEPSFKFEVSDASNLLVYDETSRQNPDWYGTIFGNGTASIDGAPGVVNINVAMTTAPGSIFTFVLNDMEEASDYTFITFRDRDLMALGETRKLVDDTPSTVRRLRERLARKEEESASEYNIDLAIDVTPSAAINLVMDPAGGDRIRSRGAGSLRMLYRSADNDLHMYGDYTLEQGDYNFTLQDIIIKDFTIKPGSSIAFTGDPFAASLKIRAAYSLTANLSDLDESFLQDKDLNRTTVPVNAILIVSGAIQQPEITFDLEFPTLTQDTYRKVRSIVSTEEMMNRQIIYLLALSRFYTPDYMGASSRNNELASVASSTISSQLGNILGSLSDNWNIAPSFRSDRGDFSDVEVDVALSSSLLNNRLLFNGNFGYRDKSLNSTQFIGDFDIEYLLNRAGTLRLKGYNRYNDMNYYVRTAQTTQGVGISFRRNFDSFGDLLKGLWRRSKNAADHAAPATTENAEPSDAE
ncbi:MAG: translocation/assembly module TamB [Muribaculaceae bacterium]|nr:translocation/assembly module TamB [Muribaculaceae bacterium]